MFIYVTYRDGQIFRFPVEIVYRHRAKRFAWQYDNDLNITIEKFVKPGFENIRFMYEYVETQMTWDDVKDHVERIEVEPILDHNKLWKETIKHAGEFVPA